MRLDFSGDTGSDIDGGKSLTVDGTVVASSNLTVAGSLTASGSISSSAVTAATVEVAGAAYFEASTSMSFVGCSTGTVSSTNSTNGSFGFYYDSTVGGVFVKSDTGGFVDVRFINLSS